MRVLHLFGSSVLGRSPRKWIQNEFEKYGIFIQINPEVMNRAVYSGNFDLFMDMMDKERYDWLFCGWELFTGYKEIWKHPRRKFKVAIFLQEQPQRLFDLNINRPFCDILLTSSPVFQKGTDGYMPNPVHTAYVNKPVLSWKEKDNSILISGSHRISRMEMFSELFGKQPFKWPVLFFPPSNEKQPKNQEAIDKIAALHPDLVLSGLKEFNKYSAELVRHLNRTKIFIDYTFNPYPDLHINHGGSSRSQIEKVLAKYKGGYAPERVLDACYMNNACFILENKALNFVLGDSVISYSNYKELVEKVTEAIEHDSLLESFAAKSKSLVEDYTTEEVIKHLAQMYISGKYSNPYQDRR